MTPDETKRTIIAKTSVEDVKTQIQVFMEVGGTPFIFTMRSHPCDREELTRFARKIMPAFRY